MKKPLALLLRTQRVVTLLTALAAFILPILALIIAGTLYLWERDWLFEFVIVIGVLNILLGLGVYLFRRGEDETEGDSAELVHLSAPSDWPPHDLLVWRQAMDRIAEEQLDLTPWADLREAALEHLGFVADTYHGDEAHAAYRFTIPELLLLFETCSARYRGFILDNVPMVNDIKVSDAILWSSRAKKGYQVYDRYRYVIRFGRAVLEPASAVVRELRDWTAGRLFQHLSTRAQRNLKSALFEHLTEAAIDLYSGRLHLSENELSAYEAQKAQALKETPVPPLRVLVIGQLNAGKSTLVNRLCESSLTDIDTLPATAEFNAHRLQLARGLVVDIVDSPGLDGSPEVENALFEQALVSDLILWVCQANQPAKSLDQGLAAKWSEHFENASDRKQPPILLVTTHNDQLLPQMGWSPPYDLGDANDPVGANMLDAYNYCREAIGLYPQATVIPMAFPEDGPAYNMDVLKQAMEDAAEEARSAQLTRHRQEAGTLSASRVLRQTAAALNQGMDLLMNRRSGADNPDRKTM